MMKLTITLIALGTLVGCGLTNTPKAPVEPVQQLEPTVTVTVPLKQPHLHFPWSK